MNLKNIDWDQDIPPEADEEYQTLINALKRKNKNEFGLFFVECSSLEAEKILSRIIHDIPEKKIDVLNLVQPINNLYDLVFTKHRNQEFDILLIKGLEYSLYHYEQQKYGKITGKYFHDISGVPPILDHLNKLRESFRDNIPVSLVFLGRPFLIDYFIHRCQDFFDWKSLNVLQLTSIPDLDIEESANNSVSKSKSLCYRSTDKYYFPVDRMNYP